jgi:uncharacterized protein YkwD
LKSTFLHIFIAISVFSTAVIAQGPSAPQPILVDVISGRVRTVRVAGTVPAPIATSLGSAKQVEARTFELMNEQRRALGLQILPWDEQVVAIAREHSENMAAQKFFSHKDSNGSFVDDRAAKAGIFNWLAIGENIAFMKGFDDPAVMAVEKWMQSASHKKNILNGQWRASAIGIATAADGSIYFTQVFITR